MPRRALGIIGITMVRHLPNRWKISGLPNPAEYGKHPMGGDLGVEHNAWLEYLWDTSLEFCFMALQMHDYAGVDIAKYQPLIRQCLTFFDQHYRQLARQRGAKELDGYGKLIIYPGSGCETFKMAYNPASTIAAIRSVLTAWGGDREMLSRVPDIPLRVIDRDTCIAPAILGSGAKYRKSPTIPRFSRGAFTDLDARILI